MRMVGPYNQSLLSIIQKTGEITRDDLEKTYLIPQPQGVVYGQTVMFDEDLQTLIDLGFIKYDGEKYIYIR